MYKGRTTFTFSWVWLSFPLFSCNCPGINWGFGEVSGLQLCCCSMFLIWIFTRSTFLFPQTCWIILCGPHQLPLGNHFQVLSLQQSCFRPFCVLFATASVQEDMERHYKQDPQKKLHQFLCPYKRIAQSEYIAAEWMRSLVWDIQDT